jgi:hypothetical protein
MVYLKLHHIAAYVFKTEALTLSVSQIGGS